MASAAKNGGESFVRYLSRSIFGNGGFFGFAEKWAQPIANDSVQPLMYTLGFLCFAGYAIEHKHLVHENQHAHEEREHIPPMPTEADIKL
mmetsp:Transcript_12071/g.26361  ORF Transcript_12071/g.26361 Transcript_12071/m.26361 type:complete len:90 (-) Transcript_12071:558-827(-)